MYAGGAIFWCEIEKIKIRKIYFSSNWGKGGHCKTNFELTGYKPILYKASQVAFYYWSSGMEKTGVESSSKQRSASWAQCHGSSLSWEGSHERSHLLLHKDRRQPLWGTLPYPAEQQKAAPWCQVNLCCFEMELLFVAVFLLYADSSLCSTSKRCRNPCKKWKGSIPVKPFLYCADLSKLWVPLNMKVCS